MSFLPCEYSIEEIKNAYGIEAINKAIEEVKSIEESKKWFNARVFLAFLIFLV